MKRPRILLVNPPIYDFAAYDFWLKPYGMLSVAGQLRGKVDFVLFDYLDRLHPAVAGGEGLQSDRWGRGRFRRERIDKPACLAGVPRYFRRFGLPRGVFDEFCERQGPFDYVLIQTVMTYWYPGVKEVIEGVRRTWPGAQIVLGGNYATLCTDHALGLGADLVITGTELDPLWHLVGLEPDPTQPALWEAYDRLETGVLKLAQGCPFRCTYCSVPQVYGQFRPRSLHRSLVDLEQLVRCGAKNIAFYDDALLYDADAVLEPFLHAVIDRGIDLSFHTPNALNARFVTADLAGLMVRAGFKTFYLGFESSSRQWQKSTGAKVYSEELAEAVNFLVAAGADPAYITAYQIVGHPHSDAQELESSMRFVHSLGIRGMLADFSPIPGTPDGEACRQWVDLDEPLMHNKTAFPVIHLGFEPVNRLKDLQRQLNRSLPPSASI